jgi:hypothetical protein
LPKKNQDERSEPESSGFIKPVFEDRAISFRKSALDGPEKEENRGRNQTFLSKYPQGAQEINTLTTKQESADPLSVPTESIPPGHARPISKTTTQRPLLQDPSNENIVKLAKQRASESPTFFSKVSPLQKKPSTQMAPLPPKPPAPKERTTSTSNRNDSIFGLDSYARISQFQNLPLNSAAPCEGLTANVTIQDLQGDHLSTQRYSKPFQVINEFIQNNRLSNQTECVVFLPDKSEFLLVSKRESLGDAFSFEHQFKKFRLSRMSDFSILEASGVRRKTSTVQRSSRQTLGSFLGNNKQSLAEPVDLETVVELPAEFPGEKNAFSVVPIASHADEIESYVIKSEMIRSQIFPAADHKSG